MSTTIIIQLLVLGLLLWLSGFFSSTETAMTTVNHLRIRSLAEEGDRRALTMEKILEDPEKMLSAILIGNNIVNISASSMATTLTMNLFGEWAVSLATGLMTLFVLIFGEITPKTRASLHAETLSLKYAPVVWALMRLMTPLIFIVNLLSGLVLRLQGVDRSAHEDTITEEDVRQFMDAGREDGVLEEHEHTFIRNVLELGDSQVHEIMVPRTNMITVNVNDSYDTIEAIFREEKFSRLPVYEDSADTIIGVINIKDFAFIEDRNHFSVSQIMYEPYFTYEMKTNAELLMEMRDKSISLTIVLDEYASVVGMVTMEDLLEELVGQIRDEYDEDEEELIQRLSDQEYLVEGSVSLDDVNENLGTALGSESYDSLGGYIMEQLERLPVVGDQIECPDGVTLRVEKMVRNRVQRVRVQLN